ncbi:MAG: MFS transporter [Chloroflexi bacterium RBG_16_60_22]|nr:MAG: MFS transporter [Chloroflexi bacterium RBG_16_60_22]
MKNAAGAVNKNIILVIATITSFIMPFLVASVNVALPTMGREFAMEAVVMTWVSTVYFLAIAMIQVPAGRLSDIFGRKKFFIIGLLLSAIASFLGGAANSVVMLLIARALQGIGAGIAFNASFSILTSIFPATERGRALGLNMAGTYTGLSLGPFIGGVMTEQFGWPSIFNLSGLLSVVLVVMVFLTLKGEWKEAGGESFDIIGSVAFSIGLALLMYGFSVIITGLGVTLFVLGALGLVFFAWWEIRTPSPIFDLTLFRRNRVFVFSNLAMLLTYVSTFALNFLMSLYLQYINGFSPQTAGLVLISASVLMAVFTPLSGRISDRIEPRLVASVGLVIISVALVFFIFLDDATALWWIILSLALYGIGIGVFSSPNSNAVMGSVDRKSLGVAAGTIGTMRTAGMMLSMGIMMVLFSLYMGQAEVTPEYYPQFLMSVRVGFIIFTALCIGAVFVQMAATFKKRRPAAG